MRIYLDTSVLVALLTKDALTDRAEAFLRKMRPALVVSDFASAEFASAIARRARVREIAADDARAAFAALDVWTLRVAERAETATVDVKTAEVFLRRLDVTLRTPDALHIAIAQRVDAELATFDDKMAVAARFLGSKMAVV